MTAFLSSCQGWRNKDKHLYLSFMIASYAVQECTFLLTDGLFLTNTVSAATNLNRVLKVITVMEF